MEVRCGNCHKLFRVPDEKITEKGIQFICTRCGEYVAVKRGELKEPPLSDADVLPGSTSVEPKNSAGLQQKQEDQISLFSDSTATVKPPVTDSATTHEPETTQAIGTDPVAVRCNACKKLFRVPSHKISGSGIKFVCTRCGEYVIISSQEIKPYILSSNAQSIPTIPNTPGPPVQSLDEAMMQNPEEKIDSGTVAESTAPLEAESRPNSEPTQAVVQEAKEETVSESELSPEPAIAASQKGPAPEPIPESVEIPQFQMNAAHVPGLEPETKTEPKIEDIPLPEPKPVPSSSSEETTTEKTESRVVSKPLAEIPKKIPPSLMPETQSRTAAPEKEQPRSTHYYYGKTTQEKSSSRNSKLLLLLVAALVVIGLLVYGVVSYLKTSSRTEGESGPSTIEGLLITSVTGTMEANGDILISGIVQNTLEKEKNAWFVVVEVYNQQGAMLNKIRLLNGKQLYTRRDYDVLAGRGVNVRDLKERSLQEQGIIIAPKSSVTFEVRYIQPPADIASFRAVLQPFDPVRLFREISEDAR
jgi:hypothetical protein